MKFLFWIVCGEVFLKNRPALIFFIRHIFTHIFYLAARPSSSCCWICLNMTFIVVIVYWWYLTDFYYWELSTWQNILFSNIRSLYRKVQQCFNNFSGAICQFVNKLINLKKIRSFPTRNYDVIVSSRFSYNNMKFSCQNFHWLKFLRPSKIEFYEFSSKNLVVSYINTSRLWKLNFVVKLVSFYEE